MLDKIVQFFTYSLTAKGMFFSNDHFKFAEVVQEGSDFKVQSLNTIKFEEPTEQEGEEENVKRLDISRLPKEQGVGSVSVSGLRASQVLVRPLDINLTKKKDIDAVLAFQAEPLLPYPPEEALLDYQILSQSDEGSLTTLFAIRKETMQEHLNLYERYEIDPEKVSCSPSALALFAMAFSGSKDAEDPILTIHLGYQETLCVLSRKGKLIANHSINRGVYQLVRAMQREKNLGSEDAWNELRYLDISEITDDEYPHLKPAVEELNQEITRTIFALAKHSRVQEVSEILLTGKGGAMTYFPVSLSMTLKSKVSSPIADDEITTSDLQEYAIPIGLAISGLFEGSVSFRKGEYAYKNPWKHIKIPIGIFYAVCLLLTLAVFYYGSVANGKKLDGVKKEYLNFIEEVEMPFEAIEKEFKENNPFVEVANLPQAESIKKMSERDLEARLEYLNEKISNAPRLYPLFPNVPSASEVLGWLAAHPNVSGKREEPLLNITGFQYTMIKRPDNKKPREKYQVKIDLEFTTETPMVAREFRDALIAPNPMVDSKSQVNWNLTGNTYRASFLLKNRTPKLQEGE